ncbi:MAG: YlbF family regulator [Oscillospiraceae bacterium]|jgi:cell fate (sporulation/competence/biofilm development) regulator YlbF (YheA/YmcA/DUF963 family)|nr:YlbF family regulator [Oscillospiraceae bacterium]
MDSILEMTRKLALKLQSDDRFIRTQMAQTAADDDIELQKIIGQFNLKRATLSNEMSKENKDNDKLKELDGEIRELYARMMANENMAAYQQAKAELDKLVKNMVTILTVAARGEDPENIEESGCGGSCQGCTGCH